MFLCDEQEKKRLLNECLIDLTLPNPKEDDLSWTIRDKNTGKWYDSTKPPYLTDVDQNTRELVKMGVYKCSICGKEMVSGYFINNSNKCYCSDECLYTTYSEEDYLDMFLDDTIYYTELEGSKCV
jgi:hypothetical protein